MFKRESIVKGAIAALGGFIAILFAKHMTKRHRKEENKDAHDPMPMPEKLVLYLSACGKDDAENICENKQVIRMAPINGCLDCEADGYIPVRIGICTPEQNAGCNDFFLWAENNDATIYAKPKGEIFTEIGRDDRCFVELEVIGSIERR